MLFNSLGNLQTGPRSTSLGENMLMKLKAIYSLTEQLYAGTLRSLVALSGGKRPPTLLKTVLEQFSTAPAQIKE
jgi:hypothetical protein